MGEDPVGEVEDAGRIGGGKVREAGGGASHLRSRRRRQGREAQGEEGGEGRKGRQEGEKGGRRRLRQAQEAGRRRVRLLHGPPPRGDPQELACRLEGLGRRQGGRR